MAKSKTRKEKTALQKMPVRKLARILRKELLEKLKKKGVRL